MPITAPGTRFAAISRAKKSSSRARPCCENPTSSGFASGNGAALIALRATHAIIVAIMTIVFFIVSSRKDRCTLLLCDAMGLPRHQDAYYTTAYITRDHG